MNIMIFDTETTNLEKPFCYNVGYCIYDTDTDTTLVKKDFVIEQIWSNLPLFSSAYYADKRPLYINRMRARKVFLKKFGHVTREMINDIKNFSKNVESNHSSRISLISIKILSHVTQSTLTVFKVLCIIWYQLFRLFQCFNSCRYHCDLFTLFFSL